MNRTLLAVVSVGIVAAVILLILYGLKENEPEFDAQPITPPSGSPSFGVVELGHAIAFAEGAIDADGNWKDGAIPADANNPGDLILPGWTGPTLGSRKISVFESAREGWFRLYHQLDLIATGQSKFYSAQDSIRQLAMKYTGQQEPDSLGWAGNVIFYLNQPGHLFAGADVSGDSPVSQFLS